MTKFKIGDKVIYRDTNERGIILKISPEPEPHSELCNVLVLWYGSSNNYSARCSDCYLIKIGESKCPDYLK